MLLWLGEALTALQYDAVIMWSFFFQNSPIRHPISCLWVSFKYDLNPASAITVLRVILWYIGLHYNGTQLYLNQLVEIIRAFERNTSKRHWAVVKLGSILAWSVISHHCLLPGSCKLMHISQPMTSMIELRYLMEFCLFILGLHCVRAIVFPMQVSNPSLKCWSLPSSVTRVIVYASHNPIDHTQLAG